MSSVLALKEIEKVMEAYAKAYAETQIEILCGYYKIDLKEALELMKTKKGAGKKEKEEAKKATEEAKEEAKAKKGATGKTKKERKLEIEIELPFSGEIDEKRCYGIRSAGKLYTQCLIYTEEGERYCKKCQKESEKNESGKPNYGDIEERKEVGLYEYKDKDGKNPLPYYKYMRKHGWTKEYIEEISDIYGIRVSEEHYNEEEAKKGAGKKDEAKKEAKTKKEEPKETSKEETKEEPKEASKEETKEETKEASKEEPKEETKEEAKTKKGAGKKEKEESDVVGSKAKKEAKLEMEIELPFSGEIDENRCYGIRSAGKLYTQCLTYKEEGERYCKKCQKESEKNESGKPNNGDIEERKEVGLYEYKDKDGKNPWPYYKLMRKHGWSKEYVEEIGAKYGIRISEEHYNEEELKKPVHQKGRIKGRPKKEEKKVEAVEEIEEVETKVVLEEEPELEVEEVIVEEEDEDEEDIVEEIEEEGNKYLRSKNNGLVYSAEDLENPTVVGIWDKLNKKIDFSYKECSDDE